MYKIGDIIRINTAPGLSISEAIGVDGYFGKVVGVADNEYVVNFIKDGEHVTHQLSEESIGGRVDDLSYSAQIDAIYVWGTDKQIDWKQFLEQRCAIAVPYHSINAFLAFCDAVDITWVDGEKASSFNPYDEFGHLSFIEVIAVCDKNQMEPPSSHCLFRMVPNGLSFMFHHVISDILEEDS